MDNINLLKYNRHWEKDFRYAFPKKREIFLSLLEHLVKKPITQLVGLRRTGKTILFVQLINHLLNKGIDPYSLWYFTFDESKPKLDDLWQAFSQQTQKDFKKEKLYIFLDEIQKLPDFQNQLKIYYDLYPNLKFFISGSTSLFLRKKSQESLAGRITEFFLYPLNFKEYLYFKEKEELLKKPLLYHQDLKVEFETFLESQFIDCLKIQDRSERKEYLASIVKKIIFEDIPQIFPVENPEVLWRIVKIIGQHPGMLVNFQNLSQELGLSNKTLSVYFSYLEEAFLVKKIFNFSRNLLTSQKKLKKYYLTSPSFSMAVADFISMGKLVENLIISLRDISFFWRDPYQHEIDFVQTIQEKIIPWEVKYQEKITNKDFKNLVLFSKKFKTNKAILFTKDLSRQKTIIKNLTIEKRPIFFLD